MSLFYFDFTLQINHIQTKMEKDKRGKNTHEKVWIFLSPHIFLWHIQRFSFLSRRWPVNIVHFSHFSLHCSSWALSLWVNWSISCISFTIFNHSSCVGGSASYRLFVMAFLQDANKIFCKYLSSLNTTSPVILPKVQYHTSQRYVIFKFWQ